MTLKPTSKPSEQRRRWTWKEISLAAGLVVTTLGGIATTYGMWSSYQTNEAANEQNNRDRSTNFTIFKTQVQDKQMYLQDQVNFLMHRNELLEQECRH